MSANSNAKEFRKRLGTHDADINAIVDEMLATMERLEVELEAASKRQAASYKESVEMATLAAHEIEALRKERDELKERLNYYSYTMGESCERADDVLEDRDRLRFGSETMTPRQLSRRYARGERWVPCCADCRKPIHMNDDAGVCIQCGGMNVRRTD